MSSLNIRKQRFNNLVDYYNVTKLEEMIGFWIIPENLLNDLRRSMGTYIAKSLHFEYTEDEDKFLERLETRREDRVNVTPNGAVVPKKEYCIEYNAYIKAYSDIIRELVKNNPGYLSKVRMTPNVRIKFANELEDNYGRPQNTSFPHTDAWLEGPWGIICHIPVFGDNDKNYLRFYKVKNESNFSDDLLVTAENFESMQWTLDYYEPIAKKPIKNCINFCDYALLHETVRLENAKTRISMDFTLYFGDYDVLPSRQPEYLSKIPRIGEDTFVRISSSEKENFKERKNALYHYSYGTIDYISI